MSAPDMSSLAAAGVIHKGVQEEAAFAFHTGCFRKNKYSENGRLAIKCSRFPSSFLGFGFTGTFTSSERPKGAFQWWFLGKIVSTQKRSNKTKGIRVFVFVHSKCFFFCEKQAKHSVACTKGILVCGSFWAWIQELTGHQEPGPVLLLLFYTLKETKAVQWRFTAMFTANIICVADTLTGHYLKSTGTHLRCRKLVWKFIWFLWNPLPLFQTPENLLGTKKVKDCRAHNNTYS